MCYSLSPFLFLFLFLLNQNMAMFYCCFLFLLNDIFWSLLFLLKDIFWSLNCFVFVILLNVKSGLIAVLIMILILSSNMKSSNVYSQWSSWRVPREQDLITVPEKHEINLSIWLHSCWSIFSFVNLFSSFVFFNGTGSTQATFCTCCYN